MPTPLKTSARHSAANQCSMRLALVLILPMLLVGLLVDWYIVRAVWRRCPAGRRFWRPFALWSSVLCQIGAVVAVCWPKRAGGDGELLALMWILYSYLSVYLPKAIFCIIDLAGKIPALFGRKRLRGFASAGIALALLCFGFMWWGALVNRYNVDVREVAFSDSRLPDSFDGFRVAQISDLHVGSYGTDTAFVSRLVDAVNALNPDVVALGNGTASRETERFLASAGLPGNPQVYVVSESGASVYSASDIARAEFPDKDVTVRGAVSIGRRLIDPLAELVKIDPKSIGVGQYQHDVDQSRLQQALDYTVMSCVNSVGVDVNTASAKLLGYISGIGPLLASNIVKYRTENGPFASRSDLRRVPRMGDKAYELSAGFLRVPLSANPLDNTGIHPESYAVVETLARRQGMDAASLAANGAALDRVDVDALAAEGLAGRETLADIVAELRKPGRDPRVDDAGDAFVPEVSAFDELREGMVLPGLVSNITAFGAFVNIGIKESGLLHISEISSRRVNSVSDVLRLGQQVRVKVIGVDTARKRISLSMKGI